MNRGKGRGGRDEWRKGGGRKMNGGKGRGGRDEWRERERRMEGRGEEGEMNGEKGRGCNCVMHLAIPTLSESLIKKDGQTRSENSYLIKSSVINCTTALSSPVPSCPRPRWRTSGRLT